MIWLVMLWIIATLSIVSISAVFAKKYGVEYLIGTVGVLIVLANILATKIVSFGPITISAGVIVFSMTFLLTDIISEKYGKKYATRAVWFGLFANILLIISLWIALNWPASSIALEMGEKFNQVMSLAPRIVLASLLAYVASQHNDVWAFHFWKKVTNGKHLWLRNNASTFVSQLIDSTIFGIVGFYGVIPIIPLILGQWIVKLIIASLDTPFIYAVLKLMKRV